MAKRGCRNRVTESAALDNAVRDSYFDGSYAGPVVRITIVKGQWHQEHIRWSSGLANMIDEARYLDEPVVLMVGNRVAYQNAATDDMMRRGDHLRATVMAYTNKAIEVTEQQAQMRAESKRIVRKVKHLKRLMVTEEAYLRDAGYGSTNGFEQAPISDEW